MEIRSFLHEFWLKCWRMVDISTSVLKRAPTLHGDGSFDFADLDSEGALEGRDCPGGIIADSGTLHVRCLGETRKVLEPQSPEPRQLGCLRHKRFIQSSEKCWTACEQAPHTRAPHPEGPQQSAGSRIHPAPSRMLKNAENAENHGFCKIVCASGQLREKWCL